MLRPILGEDKRAQHKDEVIQRALALSESQYGPYLLEFVNVDMTPQRSLTSIKLGTFINIFVAPASQKWEQETIPIKIPIRLGLLSYRLLLVHKDSLSKFKHVNTLNDLKQTMAGLQRDWVTTDVYNSNGIQSVLGHTYEGLFLMLNKNRFDYIPRAIYEIYDEVEYRKHKLQNIVIEPTLALYIPMATYAYVSPNSPQIAKRLEYGLKTLSETGELKQIMEKYHHESITKAGLQNRKIIEIENPYYNDKDVVGNSSLWLRLSKEKSVIPADK